MSTFQEHFQLNAITLNITNSCNLSCTYCFETGKESAFMTPETAVCIVDIAYEGFKQHYPDMKYFMINLFGGEPLLNWPVIKALADHVKEKKYNARLGITTNLTMLTEEMLDYIEEHEMFVLISIDGLKAVHDRNRSHSYDIVAGNIKRLIERDLGYLLEARMTVLPEDAADMAKGVEHIVGMGIYNIAPVPVTDVAWSEGYLLAFRNSLQELYEYFLVIANDVNNRKNIAFKLIDDYIEHVLEPVKEEIEPCTAGTNRWCSIGIDGDILPCHQRHTIDDQYERLKIGNILSGTIDPTRIVNPEYKIHRENQRCKDCEAKPVCRGGCPSENLTQSGNWHTPTSAWCDTLLVSFQVTKAFQQRLMNTANLRSKRLNILRTNLTIKEYFDKLCDMDIETPEFGVSLTKFYGYMDEYEEILLPSFRQYFLKKLYPLYTWLDIIQNTKGES
jgi:uncharacterized protein